MLSDKTLQAIKDSVEEANEIGGSGMNNKT